LLLALPLLLIRLRLLPLELRPDQADDLADRPATLDIHRLRALDDRVRAMDGRLLDCAASCAGSTSSWPPHCVQRAGTSFVPEAPGTQAAGDTVESVMKHSPACMNR